MIQITPQMRIVVAVDAVDFRRGIDGLARLCKEVLKADPFAGWLFVFRSRSGKSIKILVRRAGVLVMSEAVVVRAVSFLA